MFLISRLLPESLRPYRFAEDRFKARCKDVVYSGPFAGMKYVSMANCSALAPKVIGSYERELSEIVEAAIQRQPQAVVDVGAAEGYYAVGMARRCPSATVTAFEMEEHARALVKELAERNGVSDRVHVKGTCTKENLRETLQVSGEGLLICDAEGAESELMDPVAIPELRNWEILLEVHEFVISGITEIIRQRFEESHSIEQIWSAARRKEDIPPMLRSSLLDRWTTILLHEHRPTAMSWLHMVPKH